MGNVIAIILWFALIAALTMMDSRVVYFPQTIAAAVSACGSNNEPDIIWIYSPHGNNATQKFKVECKNKNVVTGEVSIK